MRLNVSTAPPQISAAWADFTGTYNYTTNVLAAPIQLQRRTSDGVSTRFTTPLPSSSAPPPPLPS